MIRRVYESLYADLARPVGRFNVLDYCAVAAGIGMLATWGLLKLGGLL